MFPISFHNFPQSIFILQITVSLMNFNCCLDPVIYFFAIKTYKKQVLSLLKDYLYTGASSKMTAENSSSNTWERRQLSLVEDTPATSDTEMT